MNVYSKEGLLILVQIDHLNGEILGSIIEDFYHAGAKNVQIVSTITKKNRPACMIFIDVPFQKAEEVEKLIVRECGSSGWHRIATCHRHTKVSIQKKQIIIRTERGCYEFEAEGKVIDDDWKHARPEYENCIKLKNFLLEKEGISIPLKNIQNYLSALFFEEKNELKI